MELSTHKIPTYPCIFLSYPSNQDPINDIWTWDFYNTINKSQVEKGCKKMVYLVIKKGQHWERVYLELVEAVLGDFRRMQIGMCNPCCCYCSFSPLIFVHLCLRKKEYEVQGLIYRKLGWRTYTVWGCFSSFKSFLQKGPYILVKPRNDPYTFCFYENIPWLIVSIGKRNSLFQLSNFLLFYHFCPFHLL